MNVLSLFSGYGQLDLAAKFCNEGSRTITYVESDRSKAEVLVRRMHERILDRAPVWQGAETFRAAHLRGHVDMALVSLGKKRAKRLEESIRIIQECSAERVFIWVPQGSPKEFVRTIVRSFAELGYDCRWEAVEPQGQYKKKDWYCSCTKNEKLTRFAKIQGYDDLYAHINPKRLTKVQKRRREDWESWVSRNDLLLTGTRFHEAKQLIGDARSRCSDDGIGGVAAVSGYLIDVKPFVCGGFDGTAEGMDRFKNLCLGPVVTDAIYAFNNLK